MIGMIWKYRKIVGFVLLFVGTAWLAHFVYNSIVDRGRAMERVVCDLETAQAAKQNLDIREKMNEDRNNRPSNLALDNLLQRGAL